jgi:hypothetical protein
MVSDPLSTHHVSTPRALDSARLAQWIKIAKFYSQSAIVLFGQRPCLTYPHIRGRHPEQEVIG